MCVSCAWPKPAKPATFEYRENGAKATAWEQTRKRIGPEFFARHTVAEPLTWTDFDLETQGPLTHPLRYDPTSDRYAPVTWEEAFAEIGRELRGFEPKSVVYYSSGRAALETSYMYGLFARLYGNDNCAGYYPELNVLIPLSHHDEQAETPAAKAIPVRVVRTG